MAAGAAPRVGAAAWSIVALVAWTFLFVAAAAQAAVRARVRSRGWQLNRALVALLSALTAVAALSVAATWRADDTGVLAAYFVLYDITDAAFLALLMAISCGFCITRAKLGEHAPSVLLVPALYFLGAITLDGLALRERGVGTASAAALLAGGIVVKLAALVYAWVFVLTAVREERSRLAERFVRMRFVADAFKLDDEEEAAAAPGAAAAVAAAAAPSRRADGTAASLAASAAIIRDAAAADGDVAETPFGPERAKERLLRGFSQAVAAYVAVVAAAALAAAFFVDAYPTTGRIQDAAQWAFMAALAWIFRPRPANPYLLLVDEYRFDSDAPEWRSAAPLPLRTVPPLPPVPPPPPPPPPPPYEAVVPEPARSSSMWTPPPPPPPAHPPPCPAPAPHVPPLQPPPARGKTRGEELVTISMEDSIRIDTVEDEQRLFEGSVSAPQR